jgi:Lar family restriction alleviation protein
MEVERGKAMSDQREDLYSVDKQRSMRTAYANLNEDGTISFHGVPTVAAPKEPETQATDAMTKLEELWTWLSCGEFLISPRGYFKNRDLSFDSDEEASAYAVAEKAEELRHFIAEAELAKREPQALVGNELLPCPFCGSGDVIDNCYIRDGRAVRCKKCGASVHEYEPEARELSITKWNTRAAR